MRSGPEKGKQERESSAVSPIPPLVCFLEPRPGALCPGAVGCCGMWLKGILPPPLSPRAVRHKARQFTN